MWIGHKFRGGCASTSTVRPVSTPSPSHLDPGGIA